jgi:hypothetical protein
MYKAMLLFSVLILLDTSDCDPETQNKRITALEAQVKQLKAEVVQLNEKPPEHHYELRNEGFRTFRFDPSTGDTCIQLTSPTDWKRKETKAQSCDCTDQSEKYLQMPQGTDQERTAASNYYSWIVKPACGT